VSVLARRSLQHWRPYIFFEALLIPAQNLNNGKWVVSPTHFQERPAFQGPVVPGSEGSERLQARYQCEELLMPI